MKAGPLSRKVFAVAKVGQVDVVLMVVRLSQLADVVLTTEPLNRQAIQPAVAVRASLPLRSN